MARRLLGSLVPIVSVPSRRSIAVHIGVIVLMIDPDDPLVVQFEDIVARIDQDAPKPGPRGPYKKRISN